MLFTNFSVLILFENAIDEEQNNRRRLIFIRLVIFAIHHRKLFLQNSQMKVSLSASEKSIYTEIICTEYLSSTNKKKNKLLSL